MPSKEHAGGVHTNGLFRVPSEWSDDQRTAVKIDFFDYESLDSVDDLIRDELALHGTAKGLLRKIIAFEVAKARSETVVKVLAQIVGEDDSGLAACEIAFASGMTELTELSEEQIGAKYGISKQAVQQGIARRCQDLGLRKTRTMRDEAAREKMSLTNFRPGDSV